MTKLNLIQRTYILATEAAKVAHAAADAELKPHFHLLETDEGIDQFCSIEMVVNEKHDIRFFDNAQMEAEKALLNWSFDAIKKLPEYQLNKETVDLVISKAYMPKIRPQLIATALRLDPKA